MTNRWCATCTTETVFETVPCEDGHGADCPELACTGCGCAIVAGVVAEPSTDRVTHGVRAA